MVWTRCAASGPAWGVYGNYDMGGREGKTLMIARAEPGCVGFVASSKSYLLSIRVSCVALATRRGGRGDERKEEEPVLLGVSYEKHRQTDSQSNLQTNRHM